MPTSIPKPFISVARARTISRTSTSICRSNELIVVTGVSGSGKSSLVFDTLYAEGQRRYVETFSPYARQFLDRMDKPQVDRIDGIPPAIAIDQTNPVRTSRSTVGTMTELNDHLKLLFARAAQLYCRGCGAPVRRDTPTSIYDDADASAAAAGDPRLIVTFPVPVPKNFSEAEVLKLLESQGYTRIHAQSEATALEVVQDRLRMSARRARARRRSARSGAARRATARVDVYPVADDDAGEIASPLTRSRRTSPNASWRFSTDLHCPDCDIHYQRAHAEPVLVQLAARRLRHLPRLRPRDRRRLRAGDPDESKTLRDGAVKPWQTPSFKECQDDLVKYAKKRGIPLDTPWRDLDDGAAALGARRRAGMGELEQILARHLVRRAALLRLAGDQGLQDAHPRAAVEVSRVHAVHGLRRRAAEARRAAVAAGHASTMPTRVLDAAHALSRRTASHWTMRSCCARCPA